MDTVLSASFPDLAHLLGAYLNQDFDVYGPTIGDAVRAFVDDDPSDHIAAARSDIQRFLALHVGALDAELTRLDPGHAHPPEMPALDYLLWLDRTLADSLAIKSAQGRATE